MGPGGMVSDGNDPEWRVDVIGPKVSAKKGTAMSTSKKSVEEPSAIVWLNDIEVGSRRQVTYNSSSIFFFSGVDVGATAVVCRRFGKEASCSIYLAFDRCVVLYVVRR